MDYRYVGYTEQGQVVRGKIAAISEQAALDKLGRVGYKVVNLKPTTSFMPDIGSFFKGRVKASELVVFSRQLALLVESGVGIVQSIELLRNQTGNRELKKVLFEVAADIRGGETLATALAQHSHVFSNLYVKIVAVGEQTGGLESVLRNLSDYIERQAATINKLKNSLTYPAIVLTLAILVGFVLVVVVFPPIIQLFTTLGGELPLPTVILLALTGFISEFGLYILVVVICLALVIYLYSRTPSGKYLRDKVILRLPVLGRISLLTELSRSCRSLSLLLKSGLSLPDVMTLASQATGNRVINIALSEVEQEMLRGEGLSTPMRKRPVFLPLMVEMTKVGEETGNLDDVLITVAQNFEVDADNRLQFVLSMVEPTMTVIIGAGVAFLALSVFLPIYSSLGLVGG